MPQDRGRRCPLQAGTPQTQKMLLGLWSLLAHFFGVVGRSADRAAVGRGWAGGVAPLRCVGSATHQL